MAKKDQGKTVLAELGAAAVGAAIGGVLGMLFAPKSGKENRKAVVRETKKAVKSASKTAQKAGKAVQSTTRKAVKAVKK